VIFAHAGDASETIYALAAVRELADPAELVLYPGPGTRAEQEEACARGLLPLLNAQRGLRATWHLRAPDNALQLDTALRRFPQPGLNLADTFNHWLGQTHGHREVPWLAVDRPEYVRPVVLARSLWHRSERRFPWAKIYEQVKEIARFLGSPEEHADFEARFGPVPHYPTPDLLAAARVIAGADLFVGNQSWPRAIAEALKVPVLVEESDTAANTHWGRAGAWYSRDYAEQVPNLSPGELVRIWSVAASRRAGGRSLIRAADLERLALLTRLVRHLPGAVAELGVAQGGSAAVLASSLPHKKLFAIDTFQGLPADDAVAGGHKAGTFAADLGAVQRFLRLYDVEYVVGTFPEVTPAAEQYCFVHIDGDLYQTTRAAIEWFRPRMTPCGVMVFDDIADPDCPGVRKALVEAGLPFQEAGNQAWHVVPT
jgi:predicted O-methyltransferase YrrM